MRSKVPLMNFSAVSSGRFICTGKTTAAVGLFPTNNTEPSNRNAIKKRLFSNNYLHGNPAL